MHIYYIYMYIIYVCPNNIVKLYSCKGISVTTSILDVHNPPKTVYRSMNNQSTVIKQVPVCNKWRKMETCLMNH